MARWRAVPTAVSTAVGALAFLASTGLALVLGAGLHVWSGPATPGDLGSQPRAGAPAVTGPVGGVVTVPPPVTRAQAPQPASSGAGPAVALPFVPFVPAAPAPAPAHATGEPAPAVPGPAADTADTPGPSSLRPTFARLRALRATTANALGLLSPSARKTLRLTTDDELSVRQGRVGHARSHGHHALDANDRARGHRHGHAHGHGHRPHHGNGSHDHGRHHHGHGAHGEGRHHHGHRHG